MVVRKPLGTTPTQWLYVTYRARYNQSPTLLHTFPRIRAAQSGRAYRSVDHGVRHGSTMRESTTDARSLVTRMKNVFLGTAIGLSLVFGYFYVTDTRAGIHRWIVVPSLRWIYDDAEEAHIAGTRSLKGLFEFGLHPRERGNADGVGDLKTEVFGHTLANPIGTSAGIDKNAEIPSPLLALGPAIVEVGGTTPYPQDGNPKPRVFRLPSQNALINRYGLNSEGADAVSMRLRQRLRKYAHSMGFGVGEIAEQRVLDGEAGVPPGSLVEGKLMAVQVAKNKLTSGDDIEAVKADYVYCVEALARYADIIVVNVSSPNTPGLRNLQQVEPLTNILTGVVEAVKKVNRKTTPAVVVKVSPDEDSDEQVFGICDAVLNSGVDGIIVGNTTTGRPGPIPVGYELSGKEATLMREPGGYSGPQLFEKTLELVKRYRAILDEGSYMKSRPIPSAYEAPPGPENPDSQTQKASGRDFVDGTNMKIQAPIQRDQQDLKEPSKAKTNSSNPQAPDQLQERNNAFSADVPNPDTTAASLPRNLNQLSQSPKNTIQPQPLPPGLSSSQRPEDDIQPQPLPPGISEEGIQPQPLPPGISEQAIQPHPPPPVNPKENNHPQPPFRGVQDEIQPQPLPPGAGQRIVIFASGGITNGKQALAILDAGASVAMVYTALVYGGVGSITRIKTEMREEMGKGEGKK